MRSTAFNTAHQLVSSLDTISPEKIDPLIEMVEGMIQENEDLIERLENNVTHCQGKVNESKSTVEELKEIGKDATQDVIDGIQKLGELNTVAAEKIEAQKIAEDESNLAEANKQSKAANLKNETVRIKREDELLNEVRDMIAGINKPSDIEIARNLLSFDIKSLLNADPQSIKDLLVLIDGLLQAGVDDLQLARDESEKADLEFEAAAKKLTESIEEKQIAEGAAVKQNAVLKKLREKETDAINAIEAEVKVLNEAIRLLDIKEKDLATQREVVEREEEQMKEVISLLESLKD